VKPKFAMRQWKFKIDGFFITLLLLSSLIFLSFRKSVPFKDSDIEIPKKIDLGNH